MEVLFIFFSMSPFFGLLNSQDQKMDSLKKIARTKNEFCWTVCKTGTLIYFAKSSFFGLWELARQKNEFF
jgi:hypothetical protein